MSNYTILQRNLLASFEHEEAKNAFLKAQECRKDNAFSYWAESVAREVDQLCGVLKLAARSAAEPFNANNDVQSDLLDFILKRHWHHRVSD